MDGFTYTTIVCTLISHIDISEEEIAMKRVYESIVSDSLLTHFPVQRGKTLLNHAANTSGIEDVIAITSLLWPEIAEEEGYVFIAEFYTQNLHNLKERFGADKQKIERWVNAWSLPQLFFKYQQYDASEPPPPSAIDDWTLVEAFGEVLQYFWSLRLKLLFPQREFVVELGEGIEGESGLAITLYEAEHDVS
jgi:hypothetical protein